MRAIEHFERTTKEPGKRNGKLGHIAIDVYRLLLRLRGRKNGRLDPTYAWLADQLKRSRSAIGEAIARLREFGFLDWYRRTQVVDDPDRPDQYVEQISNAFFFTIPAKAAELVRRMLGRPTEAMRDAAARRERDTKATGFTPEQLVAGVENAGLRAVLGDLLSGLSSASPPSGHRSHPAR